MSDHQLDPVATTARLTAAMRAAESERPDRLVDDPLAAVLAGEEGRRMFAHIRVDDVIPVRTRYFDDHLTGLAVSGVRQFVVVAAGMDTRPYRLDLDAATTWFELDRPALLHLKADLLAGVPPRCARVPVEVDLTGDWPPALAAAGFDPAVPTGWLVEGLLQYLDEPDVLRLLDTVAGLSAPGSHLLTDFVGRALMDDPAARDMLAAMERSGMPWVFATDEPAELLTARGWTAEVSSFSAVGIALGRWTAASAPGPRDGFLSHARR